MLTTRLLALLGSGEPFTVSRAAEALEASPEEIRRLLTLLEQRGRIKRFNGGCSACPAAGKCSSNICGNGTGWIIKQPSPEEQQ